MYTHICIYNFACLYKIHVKENPVILRFVQKTFEHKIFTNL